MVFPKSNLRNLANNFFRKIDLHIWFHEFFWLGLFKVFGPLCFGYPHTYPNHHYLEITYSFCKTWFWSNKAFFSDSSCFVDDSRILMSSRNPLAISSSESSFKCRILASNPSFVTTSWKKHQKHCELWSQKHFQKNMRSTTYKLWEIWLKFFEVLKLHITKPL